VTARHGPRRALALSFALLALGRAGNGEEGLPFCLADQAGAPIPGARVSVLGRKERAVTDERGCFRLRPEPRAPFALAVFDPRGAWLGVIRVENTEGASARRITLPRAAHEEVTVRAGAPLSTEPPPAAAVSVVSRPEIEENHPDRLGDALEELPGTGQLEEGQSTVPSLRGLARGRTLILLDGARVTSERRAGPSAGYLDPLALEAIEVVRGPGSVAYGSDALGGVIHATTPLPRAGDFGGRISLSAGSADESASGLAEANVPAGAGALLFQAHQRSFGQYESPRGRVANSSARDRGFLARALLPVGKGRLLLGAQLDEGRDIGKPSTDSDAVRASYPREDSYRFTVGAKLPPALGFTEIEAQAFVGRYRLVTERDRRAAPSRPRQLARSDIEADDASLRAVAARPAGKALLRFGLDLHGRFDLSARGLTISYDEAGAERERQEEVSIGSARRIDAGAFAEAERGFLDGRLGLASGIRMDRVAAKNEGGFFGGRSRSEAAVSGYLAATVNLPAGQSLTFQYARGFREPTLSDRYFRGVSGRGFVVGNPDLDPETSDQYDLAFRTFLGSSARVAVYGYLYRIRDLIERYPRGADFAFRNRGEEELRGIEVESDVDFSPRLTARLTASAASGRIKDDGSRPADIPAASLRLSFRHRVSERLWWRGRLSLVARDEEPGPTEKETPGYTVLDLAVGLRVTRTLEAGLLLENLTDRAYPDSPDEKAVAAPGRSVTLTLGQKF